VVSPQIGDVAKKGAGFLVQGPRRNGFREIAIVIVRLVVRSMREIARQVGWSDEKPT
jgi:hypothetical protein